MDIFWWAVIIIAVLSMFMLCVGLAVVVPVRNSLRRRQAQNRYHVDPGGAGNPMYGRRPPAPQQPLGQPGPPYAQQWPPTGPGRR
ncbi:MULTISPECIES: hypothetical protein [Actinomycetes]|uniref:hypothetical protein n=1 Tax=Actinomycetes TaxID=1760 RepID=UPI0001DEE81B|nr:MULTISPECIES: hypothetical protein [Actinomycetes]EFL09492.1 predicted protein [Streptomyces sp. AA4]